VIARGVKPRPTPSTDATRECGAALNAPPKRSSSCTPCVVRPRRLSNASYTGRWAYFLTICTFGRRECFNDAMLVHRVWSQFTRTAEANGFDIPAYCFMLDHLHLLAEGVAANADLCDLSPKPSAWRRTRRDRSYVGDFGSLATTTASFAILTTLTRSSGISWRTRLAGVSRRCSANIRSLEGVKFLPHRSECTSAA